MTLANAYNLSGTVAFKQKVRSATVQAALDVAAEDAGTARHAERLALSSQILTNPDHWANLFAIGVANNATIQTDFPPPSHAMSGVEATVDGDIQFVVNSLYNAYI